MPNYAKREMRRNGSAATRARLAQIVNVRPGFGLWNRSNPPDMSQENVIEGFGVNGADMGMRLIKYFLEGLAVAIATMVIPKQQVDINSVLLVSLTAASTFLILDTFAPSVGMGARKGAGFGIGLSQVGSGRLVGLEPFEMIKPNPGCCPKVF